jgi:hypothetical protein
MKYLRSLTALLFAFFILLSCKKAGADNVPAKTIPGNLVVSSLVTNDSSGIVTFTAKADNAVTYNYDFGNGENANSSTGEISYQYTSEGTHTYTVTITATSSNGGSVKKSITVGVITGPPFQKLFWAEEFDKDGTPDPAKWGYNLGDGCPGNCGWGNNELEWYTNKPENVIVEGGLLKIKAIKETSNGKNYTSARMVSQDKFSFKYGKVEVRAKLPEGIGTWPAIWMLGSDIGTVSWPACGEIDIMEHLGRDLNKIYGTLHYPGHSGGSADGSTTVISNATSEFHIYSLEWSASALKIFVDGVLFHTTVNYRGIPFNHDFFFILNVAMGGGFAGAVDAAFTNATMEVDYVRVYK